MRLLPVLLLSCLALHGSAPLAAAPNALDTLKDLGRDLGGVPKLLPPEQAFKVAVRIKDATTLVAEFSPAAAYYLYREKFRFALRDAQGVGIAAVRLPKGEQRDGIRPDATFGRVEVYRKPVVAEIELGREGAVARKIVFEAGYQGCSEKGVCYPPLTRRFELLLPSVN